MRNLKYLFFVLMMLSCIGVFVLGGYRIYHILTNWGHGYAGSESSLWIFAILAILMCVFSDLYKKFK